MVYLSRRKLVAEAPVDTDNPVDGIFHKIDIQKFYEKVDVSVRVSSKLDGYSTKPPEELLLCEPNLAWHSINEEDAFVEIILKGYELEVTHYTLMANALQDEIPRNWELTCFHSDEKYFIATEKNNQQLCPGKNGENVACGSYDTKIFPVNAVKKCDSIRITQNGPNSRSYYFFTLSGIEFFGKLYQIASMCSNLPKQRGTFMFFALIYIISE